MWIVRFADNYVKQYIEKDLRKILVHVTIEKEGKQLDYYVFVSRRWKSAVTDSKVRWTPSRHRHRDLHGEKTDHGLVATKWKWRIACEKNKPAKDFSTLEESKYLDKKCSETQSKINLLKPNTTARRLLFMAGSAQS